MITYDEEFCFERDKYQWILHHQPQKINPKTGKKPKPRETYHATLQQVVDVIVDRKAGACESMEEVKQLIMDAKTFFSVPLPAVEVSDEAYEVINGN